MESADPRQRVMTVGLTGGIGSGKSTIAGMFQALGVPVIDSDDIAHQLTGPDGRALAPIFRRFGTSIRQADGSMNRAALRKIVFSDAGQRQLLESILHPLIRAEIDSRIHQVRFHYCIVGIPLLVETGRQYRFDRVLVVEAPMTKRLEWIHHRSNLDDVEIARIMAAQASDEQRREVADDVIVNDSSVEALEPEVLKLHKRYLRTAISEQE